MFKSSQPNGAITTDIKLKNKTVKQISFRVDKIVSFQPSHIREKTLLFLLYLSFTSVLFQLCWHHKSHQCHFNASITTLLFCDGLTYVSGAEVERSVAVHLLHDRHRPLFVLSCQPYSRHCGHVIRRLPETRARRDRS